MKKLIRIVFVLTLVTLGTWLAPQKIKAQDVDVQIFYDQLSPYGSWVNYPTYGYVWVPAAEAGFTPYGTAGHWEWTDAGWLWVSDYPWGWAPFHYGRWFFDNAYGWMWEPGRTWAPAWVCWRSSPGYYGWTPLGPGYGINSYSRWNPPADHWVFINQRYINDPHMYNHYEGRSNNVTIIKNTTIINNTYVDKSRHTTYIAGPRRAEAEKATGATIKPVAIRDNARPGQSSVGSGEVNIYRPAVQKAAANTHKPAPQKVATAKELKPMPGAKPEQSRLNRAATVKQNTTAPRNATHTNVPITQPQNRATPNANKAPAQQKTNVPVQRQPNNIQRQAPRQRVTQPKNAAPRANPGTQQARPQAQPKIQQAPQRATPQQPVQHQAPRQTAPVRQAPAQQAPRPQAMPQQQAPAQQAPRQEEPRPQPRMEGR